MSGPFPQLRERVLQQTKLHPSPTRAQAALRRRWMLLATILVLSAAAFVGVPDPPAQVSWLLVGATLLCCGVSSWWLVLTATSPLGHPRLGVVLSSCAVPLVLTAGALVASRGVLSTSADSWMCAHTPCVITYLLLGSIAFSLTAYGLRPMDPVSPGVTGLALSTAVSSWAALVLAVSCPRTELVHLVTAHAAPSVLLGVAGATFGRRYFRVRDLRDRRTSVVGPPPAVRESRRNPDGNQ